MKRIAFDIETNGLLDAWTGKKYTKVHCIVLRDIDNDDVQCYHESTHIAPRAGGLLDALAVLAAAEFRCSHNGLAFDEVVLANLGFKSSVPGYDTFVVSHMLWPEIEKEDKLSRLHRARIGAPEFPSTLVGQHGLEAWGFRLGLHKGTFGKEDEGAFEVFTQEMLDYCIQDTAVLVALLKREERKIAEQKVADTAIQNEHKFAEVLARQVRFGIYFDTKKANELWREWERELIAIDASLAANVAPWVENYVTPKRREHKSRTKAFNPGSRQQVARLYSERYGHQFVEKTDGGQDQVDEAVLKSLVLRGLPFAADIERRFLLSKRISALADSPKGLSWLAAVCNDGRVHPKINHHGAVTSRCTHSAFNITGVPRVTSPFGKECRSLFTASPGWVLAGGDAKGLELRLLAHLLAPYDGGKYIEIVTEGDPHGVHQEILGFTDHGSMSGRDRTKTFWYAWTYGAGFAKLGYISVDGIQYISETKAVKLGKELVGRLESRIAGLMDLKASLNKHLTGLRDPGFRAPLVKPWIRSLDGRILNCRSTHSALNLACQGGGAVAMKVATVLVDERMQAEEFKWREDYGQIIHAHDEFQFDCRTPEIADRVVKAIEWALPEAGRILKLRCPLAASTKTGANWSETH